MKPSFILGLLMSIVCLSSFTGERLPSKTIQFGTTFISLVVNDDLNVILTEGASDKIVIDGDANAVRASVFDGQLCLSLKEASGKYRATVYVPSSLLSSVYLNAAGQLQSQSVLANQRLRIVLAAEAKVHVRSTGKLEVETQGDIQFVAK